MATSLIFVMPMLAFLFVFIVSFALLSKTKFLGDNQTTNILVSFLIAVMFVINPPATKVTLTTVPWLAVLMVVLLFIMMILVFVRGSLDDLVKSKVVAAILVAAILLVFLGASVNVFGPLINMISEGSLEPAQGTALELFLSPAVIGGVVLLVIAGISYWLLTMRE
ncbi:hypothetical protein ACFLZZ_02060 [Nanoarchaeota archaeon]